MSSDTARGKARYRAAALLPLVLAIFCLLPAGASANRALLSTGVVDPSTAPGGALEDPCGIALTPSGQLYVSAYYAGAAQLYSAIGRYTSALSAASSPEGPCQLALDASGNLYANIWHQGVKRTSPSPLSFDTAHSTGVAVDASGRVYVDDRTYIAIYEPNGAEVGRVGLGHLGDAYGLAVSGGLLYVADAAAGTIKAFSASGEPTDGPLLAIDGASTPPGKFISLTDAALAADPTNGHLLAVDNLQPGFVHPKAAIYEFDAAGNYLGQLPGEPIDGGPSGLAVSETGTAYLTSGNSEEGTVLKYGAYSEGLGPLVVPGGSGSGSSLAKKDSPVAFPAAASASAAGGPPASASETIQHGRFRVGVDASLAPKRLPRSGTAPVRFSLAAKISATKGAVPPQLRMIEIEINRFGHIEPKGLPVCEVDQIQPATNEAALEACPGSLIGEGTFSAKVLISQQAPFPSDGKVYAFNGTWKGRPAILAHVYGTKPVPTSSTIPFEIGKAKGSTYGTKLTASLPQVTSEWGYVTGISMKLGKTFSSHGKRRSYLSAGCPAPKGFPGATFPLSRTNFAFEGGTKLSSVLSRSCQAK
ncbi:MAG TPA: hypothetical protein VH042_09900 [Solirubrobacterales bacterium]|jgi:DNA-binding beta-propeller fold protein YncE|nr:hypothetical protein [Solirubrobacterales bacterium]